MNKIIALFKRNYVKVATAFVAFGTMVNMVSGNSLMDSLSNSILTAMLLVIAGCIVLTVHYSTSSVK